MPNDSPVAKAREMAGIKASGEDDAKNGRVFKGEDGLTVTSPWIDEVIRREARSEVEELAGLAKRFACELAAQGTGGADRGLGSVGAIVAAEEQAVRSAALMGLLGEVEQVNARICGLRAESEARIAAYLAGVARRDPEMAKLSPADRDGESVPGPRDALCGIEMGLDGVPKPKLPAAAGEKVSLLALPMPAIGVEGSLPAPEPNRQEMLLQAPDSGTNEQRTEVRRMA